MYIRTYSVALSILDWTPQTGVQFHFNQFFVFLSNFTKQSMSLKSASLEKTLVHFMKLIWACFALVNKGFDVIKSPPKRKRKTIEKKIN